MITFKKPFFIALFFTFFPCLSWAADLSFTPPASDFSMVFLANIFGIVDGVLNGTGSQIMGIMFGVFNAAVLAVGGMVIMYTLLVSTLNTAQEGQLLGQKWSSIWIPVRSVIGLTLLIPKASGYCLMQIFVMWIVVQGVGAADKIWNAALDYLNRGGVIIQAEGNPATALIHGSSSKSLGGAQTILAGQVCMLGLQEQLQVKLNDYKKRASESNDGPCAGRGAQDQTVLGKFCNSVNVPNFINSVNVVDYQDKHPPLAIAGASSFALKMPNFSEAPYSDLNGICGTITWKPISSTVLDNISNTFAGLSRNMGTISMSRAIAIQQMYLDLSAVAQLMVKNDPEIGAPNATNDGQKNYSANAIQPYGIPQTAYGEPCDSKKPDTCIIWGTEKNTGEAPLLKGRELMGAAQDYEGIMLPTLTLIKQLAQSEDTKHSRKFIEEAQTKGWIMAGSYFFYLVNLNVASSEKSNELVDSDTGLPDKTDVTSLLESPFAPEGCKGDYATLCTLFDGDPTKVRAIISLIQGRNGANGNVVPQPDLNGNQQPGKPLPPVIKGPASSTVFGYTNNATLLRLPGQPGYKPLMFADVIEMDIDTKSIELPESSFECGGVPFLGCVGRVMAGIFYNYIIRYILMVFIAAFHVLITQVLYVFLMLPIQGMAIIFKEGLSIISTPGVNPVVALAKMGTYYINFAADFWLKMTEVSMALAMIPWFGAVIFALIAIAMPLLMAWLGIMLGIGFTTAYYVPLLPYMIFTFGAIAWLMAVIEAMVAAPIVALGVTHPEGHDAFGKGEGAIMILMNVFLRPSMMIIGYIGGIALAYVSVWILNAGFETAIGFIQGNEFFNTEGSHVTVGFKDSSGKEVKLGDWVKWKGKSDSTAQRGQVAGGYTQWAGLFAYFFSIISYTMLYLTVVQKAFTLISALPDKVLRWIGGQQESYGSDVAQWGQEVQNKVSEAGKDTASGQAQMDKQLEATTSDITNKLTGSQGDGSNVSGKGGKGGGKGGGGGGGGKQIPPEAEMMV